MTQGPKEHRMTSHQQVSCERISGVEHGCHVESIIFEMGIMAGDRQNAYIVSIPFERTQHSTDDQSLVGLSYFSRRLGKAKEIGK